MKITVIVTSLIFGLIHLESLGVAKWYNMLFLVIAYSSMGLMFTLIAIEGKSFWASFAVHAVNNFLIYFIGIWAAVSSSSAMLWRSLVGTLVGTAAVSYLVYYNLKSKPKKSKNLLEKC